MQHNAEDLGSGKGEAMRLLSPNDEWIEMASDHEESSTQSRVKGGYADEESHAERSGTDTVAAGEGQRNDDPIVYKVYKIRWFGLFQLVLLNIIVSWDVRRTIPFLFPRSRRSIG